MNTPTMTCPTCAGKGTTELPVHLADTLDIIQRAHKPMTAEDVLIRLADKVSVNAISNRLVDLFLLQLVTRHREGKFWLYSANLPAKPKKRK